MSMRCQVCLNVFVHLPFCLLIRTPQSASYKAAACYNANNCSISQKLGTASIIESLSSKDYVFILHLGLYV